MTTTNWTNKNSHEARDEALDNDNTKLARLIEDAWDVWANEPAEMDEQDLGDIVDWLNEAGRYELAADLKTELDNVYGEGYDGPTGPEGDAGINQIELDTYYKVKVVYFDEERDALGNTIRYLRDRTREYVFRTLDKAMKKAKSCRNKNGEEEMMIASPANNSTRFSIWIRHYNIIQIDEIKSYAIF